MSINWQQRSATVLGLRLTVPLLTVALLVIAFMAADGEFSPCSAQAASCPVGSTETFAGNFILQSNTAFDVEIDHSATADATLTIPDTAGAADTFVLSAQAQTLTNKTLTAPDINGGTVDSVVIGGAVPAAGTVTTLNATGGGSLTGTWTDHGTISTVDLNGGTIDGTTIGGVSAAPGTFTTITAGGTVDLANNNLTNVGLAGTDITSTGADFDVDITTTAGTQISVGGEAATGILLDVYGAVTANAPGVARAALFVAPDITTVGTTAARLVSIGGGEASISGPATGVVMGSVASLAVFEPGVVLAGGDTMSSAVVVQIGGAATEATNNYSMTVTGYVKLDAPTINTPGSDTLAGGATTFSIDSSVHQVNCDGGGNTIATITVPSGVVSPNGIILTLIFVDTDCTITDTDAHTANTVDLSAAFTSADDTTLTLLRHGGSWYETARSVN